MSETRAKYLVSPVGIKPACRAARLVAMAELLCDGPRTTMQMAERFQVSRWTVLRDLRALASEPFNLDVRRVSFWVVEKLLRE